MNDDGFNRLFDPTGVPPEDQEDAWAILWWSWTQVSPENRSIDWIMTEEGLEQMPLINDTGLRELASSDELPLPARRLLCQVLAEHGQTAEKLI